MNKKEFVFYLKRQKDLVRSKLATAEQEKLFSEKRIKVLDSIAELLGGIFSQALEVSTSHTQNSGGGSIGKMKNVN